MPLQRIPRLVLTLFAASLPIATVLPVSAQDKEPLPTALFDYVSQPDDVYGWKLLGNQELEGGKVYDIELTSQKWQNIVWKHALHIYEPAEVRHPNHVLLFITGGSNGRRPGGDSIATGMKLAHVAKARVATLYHVPNQPLFDGRVEDDLITDTWLRYLDSGDASWPLLFPMVKSAVRAMDAVQEIAAEKWNVKVEGFVTTGASKRGWTSWLTPVADERVLATAPIVIDVLNFQPQMRHQMDTWGEYSEQIHDYTSKGLVKLEDESERELALRRMMDPYTYRRKLSLPKLLVNGTNDRYWVLDAMKFYWYELSGPKYVLQVPNAGHGLDGGRELALGTVAVFFRHTASGTPLPELDSCRRDAGSHIRLRVTASAKPDSARLWTATSPTKDFREAQWRSQTLDQRDQGFEGRIVLPDEGHIAHFAELQFKFDGAPFSLCTLIQRD